MAPGGALGLFLIIFAETGLLIGFFLPGDTLLLAAGVLCATPAHATGHLSLPVVLAATCAGALVGAQTGYLIGRHAGHALLSQPDRGRLRHGAARAREVLDRYGVRRALIIARFIPVIRTAISPLAGATGVPWPAFTIWQAAGGLLWAVSMTLTGYVLGSRLAGVSRYVVPGTGLMVLLSPLPLGVQMVRRRLLARARTASGRCGPTDHDADPVQLADRSGRQAPSGDSYRERGL
jgi:membrane-associated protein